MNQNLDLSQSQVGWRVRFAEEKQAYTIQARGNRYLVCSKPFNALRTTLYTVVDLQEGIRGTEGVVFQIGAETRQQCEEMLTRLEGREGHIQTEVSYRNRVPLSVVAVMPA